MSNYSILSALLSREEEPGQGLYNVAVESIVNDPQEIRRLTEGDAKHESLIQLTAHSHRLARVFRGLRSFAQKNPKSSTTAIIAAETVTLLVETLSSPHQLLTPAQVLEILIPALDTCFASCTRPNLRELASVLANCDTLLEHLAADRFGSKIIRQWGCSPGASIIDASNLEVWTERLVKIVRCCMGSHDVEGEIQQWAVLVALKDALQSLEARLLHEEDKETSLARGQETNSHFIPLDDNLKGMLKTFDLAEPKSRRMVQIHIESLKSSKVPAIFRPIATSFPCKRCIPALGSTPRSTNAETHDQKFASISDLHIDVLGRAVGVWKVLLSEPALRSIKNMSRLGLFGQIREKLIDLAFGCCKSSLAGSGEQRERLKVPLASTRCGQNLHILWQVDIQIAGDMELLQQVIVVWEVGDLDTTSKALDRVVHLQGGYTDETIRRCRQRPTIINGKQVPACFNDYTLQSVRLGNSSAEFDVRTVHQDTIDMASKFYPLTEPVIRSILDNDLAAEFPFDLSREEARVFAHFQTASLMLGRSGTGKTTCLVFKLVGKFLVSMAVLDERPVRQVLLTRSGFLAEKIGTYTRRLIETLLSKSSSSELEGHLLSRTTEEDSDSDSVLTLRDQSFPLICTFDRFLQILENTTLELDRQNFCDLKDVPSQQNEEVQSIKRSYQRQPVDFYAFKVDYWPRFSQTLTRDLSVNLVFAEIMGVIKGSVSSRESLRPISCEEYLTRSCRMAPTFASEAERLRVYDIFGLYEKMKIERGDVDYVDRVVRILMAVRRDSSLHQLLRSTFDEVYIDEIQDQRCLDIELFLSFLKDIRGCHFAGDTAQAISHDSTFRFSDIKRLFHEHFADTSASIKQSAFAEPQMFTLSKNYRSHQGILALASLVMAMIWKGFPETVDKLDPEVGYLSGPKPVLFLGCDVEILRSSNVGSRKLSDRAADFGAEQVILVRDTRTKTSLQDQIGDVALILTILESKGMEFDDVILWNFFSDCPDQAGVRSLNVLKTDTEGFDSKKYGGMCSELKHLYVAITRARSHLSIVEGSHPTAVPLLNLLTQGSSGSLVEVTGPNHENFAVRVEMLRPSPSMDPAAWLRRADEFMRRKMFKDAIMAFHRAGDTQGETRAQGCLHEEEGKMCRTPGDFTGKMRIATEYFLKANLVDDAVRVLLTLGELGEAAKLWFQRKQYARAVPLFVDARLYIEAAECHHRLHQHSEAAAYIRQGSNYDRLVSYVDRHSQSIPSDTLRGYSLLCKILLKQSKVSPEYREHAINLLGSPDDQEDCFREYGMDEQLIELYAGQKRHKDLYDLFSRTGQLARALETGLSKGMLRSTAGVPESELLKLLDYVWAGRMTKKGQQDFAAALKLRSDHLTPNMNYRFEQWEAGHRAYNDKGSYAYQKLADMEDTVVKQTLTLQNITDATAVPRIPKLDEIPFKMMQQAVRIVKNFVLKDDKQAQSVVFVLLGIWTLGGPQEQYVPLPWSPLYGTLTDLSTTDVSQVAKKWLLDKTACTVLALDSRARVLWNSKWRIRCHDYLTTGICKQRNCQKLHEHLSLEDCSRLLEDMLKVNNFFCDLAILYYRHVMGTTFQKKYLEIRRHWLERLLRELTFFSATEQSALAITKTQTELLRGNKFLVVRSSLEELLYFRLGNEWRERSDFTSLLEQMQIAEAFGPIVRSRLFRALSQNLQLDHRGSTQRHLGLLIMLKLYPERQTASIFRNNLETFLRDLDHHKVRTFASLHSFTTVCESLATYLILKTCFSACVLTDSWINLYRPSIDMAATSRELLEFDDRYRYQQCLIELTKAFCRVIRRLSESPSRIKLLCSGKEHEALPLQRRNAELVAILIASVATTSIVPTQIWNDAEKVFAPDIIRATQRQKPTPGQLIQKLAPPPLKHNNKDALVVIIKDRKKGPVFSNLEGQPGVKTLPFDQLCPREPESADVEASVDPSLSTSTNDPQGEYTQAEKDAVAKIKKLWLSCSPKIKRRLSYVSLPECRAIARLFNMSAQCPASVNSGSRKAIRKLLVSKGVALSLRLDTTRGLLSKLQKDAMECIENVEISQGGDKSVDDILCRNRDVADLLEKAEVKLSDEGFAGLVKLGVLSVLEEAFKEVGDAVAKAEQLMFETRKMVDTVFRKVT